MFKNLLGLFEGELCKRMTEERRVGLGVCGRHPCERMVSCAFLEVVSGDGETLDWKGYFACVFKMFSYCVPPIVIYIKRNTATS